MISRLVLWAAFVLALGGCVTDESAFLSSGTAAATKAAGVAQNSTERPVGGPHTIEVMAMDWPSDLAPLKPVARRLSNLSRGADWLFLQRLQTIAVDDQWGHHINPALVEALFSSNTMPTRLAALDFARDRTVDDTLSTQFLLTYARLLAETPGLQDTAAINIIAADLTAIIDSARCMPDLGGEMYTGVLSRRRDFAPLYAIARDILMKSDERKRVVITEAVLLTERRTAPIRKDVVLCRYGAMYMDYSAGRKANCGAAAIGTCYKFGDNKSAPTRWADEDKWRQHRIKILREMTPNRIIEMYSGPLPQALG